MSHHCYWELSNYSKNYEAITLEPIRMISDSVSMNEDDCNIA